MIACAAADHFCPQQNPARTGQAFLHETDTAILYPPEENRNTAPEDMPDECAQIRFHADRFLFNSTRNIMQHLCPVFMIAAALDSFFRADSHAIAFSLLLNSG